MFSSTRITKLDEWVFWQHNLLSMQQWSLWISCSESVVSVYANTFTLGTKRLCSSGLEINSRCTHTYNLYCAYQQVYSYVYFFSPGLFFSVQGCYHHFPAGPHGIVRKSRGDARWFGDSITTWMLLDQRGGFGENDIKLNCLKLQESIQTKWCNQWALNHVFMAFRVMSLA